MNGILYIATSGGAAGRNGVKGYGNGLCGMQVGDAPRLTIKANHICDNRQDEIRYGKAMGAGN